MNRIGKWMGTVLLSCLALVPSPLQVQPRCGGTERWQVRWVQIAGTVPDEATRFCCRFASTSGRSTEGCRRCGSSSTFGAGRAQERLGLAQKVRGA